MSEKIEDNGDRDVIDLPLEELRYKHIILRNLQKTAILNIKELEEKNINLTNEVIKLQESITTLSKTNSINQKLMINALTNNNSMKDDYRNRIQALEQELSKYQE